MLGAFSVVKFAVQALVTASTTKVVGDVVKNNTTMPVTVANKIVVWTGSTVLGLLVADRGSEYVGEAMENGKTWLQKRNTDATEPEVVES